MNRFKIESPFRRSRKSKDPTEKTRAIAERLYRNRQVMKRSGSAEEDWARAERIFRSPIRRVLLRLNQPLIQAEKKIVEPTARWVERADLFRVLERLSPTLEALGVIAIPLVLFFAAQGYEESLRRQELERIQQQTVTDYLNQLSTILLDLNGSLGDPQNAELRTLMTATTLTLLRDPNLDGSRKGQVIKFLSQVGLVQRREFLYGPQRPDDEIPIISLRIADFSDIDLSNTDLSYTDLNGADFRYINFTAADLRGADFSHADLGGVNFSYANLSYANLNHADFSGANFAEVNSRVLGFNVADLSGANLEGVSLRHANLSGVNFSEANLRLADLRSAKNLKQSQLEKAYLCATELPQGITADPNRDCKEGWVIW